ncbi:serine/threonine protein kinase, partial [Elasticomyces elasticus]
MRDKANWAANSARITAAQAKLIGDHEVQSMMELLSRAKLLGPDVLQGQDMNLFSAPLTGPARVSGENPFENSFLPRTESPTHETSLSPTEERRQTVVSPLSPSASESGSLTNGSTKATTDGSLATSPPVSPSERRATLKRTYTDVASLFLQNKLQDALAQPYHAGDTSQTATDASTHAVPTMSPPLKSLTPHGPSGAPHGHGSKYAPVAQAVFTTEAQAPWTITAANDLACLVFGVTKAEVRKLGILEVVQEESRKWLESRLKDPDQGASPRQKPQSQRSSPSPSTTMSVGNGVTAKLLSKRPARETYQSRRSKTDDGSGSSYASKLAKGGLNHTPHKSRGVLLCGDVLPIQKRNGAVGSASLWVKEKRGGLIWVLEEIAEDVAYLSIDDVGCVTKGTGSVEAIWGLERVRRGMDVKKLIPEIPRKTGTNTGILDYEKIAELRRFTARTANSISIPVTVDQLPNESTFRISSFPHIAGITVLSAATLTVISSNTVFSAALFGQSQPKGLHVTELIPGFDKILNLMTDEDKISLVDGIVIPEHSFRRARALLALREGKADAAAVFLRPSGLPAKHRDGAEIMVDVQMRVVKSDRHDPRYNDSVIEEAIEEDANAPLSEIVYALWITYSRHLHATNHGVGPVTPLTSRPGTPPRQAPPAQPTPDIDDADSERSASDAPPRTLLMQQINDSQSQPIGTPLSPQTTGEGEPFEHPSPYALAIGAKTVKKKSISDFVILEEMGQGAYGQVKLARYKKGAASKMVIKYVTKRRILVDTWTRDRKLGTVPLEIHVLDFLRREDLVHPNIVEMADFFEDDVNYYIEMVPHGLPGMDLFDYIELRATMDEQEARNIFLQVAAAIHHLHIAAKVVHRDIKDENVILDGVGAVKLVDFGSAAYIKNGPFDVF